jgi:hypothetical protein
MSYLYRTRQKDPKGNNIIIYQGSGSPCAAAIKPKHRGDLYIDVGTGTMYMSRVWFPGSTSNAYATMWHKVLMNPAP